MTLGLGYTEIAIILIIALIVIGPRRLPELMRTVGKLMGQLRRASDDLRREILFGEEIRSIKDAVNPFSPPPVPPRIRTRKKSEDETPPSPQPPETAEASEAAPNPSPPRTDPDGQ